MKFANSYQPHPSMSWGSHHEQLAQENRWVAVNEVAPNTFVLIGFYNDVTAMIREGIRFARRHDVLIVSDQLTGDTHVFDDSVVEVE